MPELPEVETFRRYIASTSLHLRIDQIKVCNDMILGNTPKKRLIETLRGRMIVATKRYGKYLGAELDSSLVLVLHFGMTGKVNYYRNPESAPGHITLLLDFENGYRLAFSCVRMLCRIYLSPSMKDFVKWKKLGPDALDALSFELFRDILSRRTGRIKSLLIDQHFLSGIGNIYADEILFQARIHPLRRADSLSSAEVRSLHETIGKVLGEAVKVGADWDLIPHGFLTRERGPGGNCPICGILLKAMKVGGRTSYFCPEHQRDQDVSGDTHHVPGSAQPGRMPRSDLG
jgi:formamidopyrimidine-DNA glycosylase